MEKSDLLFTHFASPERASDEKLKSQCMLFLQLPQMKDFIDAVPNIYLILNENRQIVYANGLLKEMLGTDNDEKIYGLRPGEVLSCKHSIETAAGCGTSEACETCGAVNAIIASLEGKSEVQECRIEDINGNAYDFRVWTTPYIIGGQKFAIFALSDISDEKRRSALERIFFHDILNTAGGLKGFAELLKDAPEDVDEFKEVIFSLSERIIDEIRTQKILLSAEKNELIANNQEFLVLPFLEEVCNSFKSQLMLGNKNIELIPCDKELTINSDRTLLWRVIANMIKNAVEASRSHDTVTVSAIYENDEVIFNVHNPTFMPKEIQLQIFQRSFSTKGTGRGLGTYSMKLLGEKFLNGKIYFKSIQDTGTTFSAKFSQK